MTHYTGETEQYGTPLTISEIMAICRQGSYQERRWWKVNKNQIVGVGTESTGVFSWRGFVVKSTGDYQIYRPYALTSAGWLDGLWDDVRRHDTVLYGELTEAAVDSWFDTLRVAIDRLAAKKSLGDSARTRLLPVDGIPWELHAISDPTTRNAAVEAYLAAQV